MKLSPFIEQVRSELRTRYYSLITEKTYLYWIRHFILFNDKRHPQTMDNSNIEPFFKLLVRSKTSQCLYSKLSFMHSHIYVSPRY
jgi:hypothetical protein